MLGFPPGCSGTWDAALDHGLAEPAGRSTEQAASHHTPVPRSDLPDGREGQPVGQRADGELVAVSQQVDGRGSLCQCGDERGEMPAF